MSSVIGKATQDACSLVVHKAQRLFVLLITLNLSGCSGDYFFGEFVIEQNGVVYAIGVDEANQVKGIELELDGLGKRLEYAKLPNTAHDGFQGALDIYRGIKQSNNNIVNADIYNFIVVVPIKSDKNIWELPSEFSDFRDFTIESCQQLRPSGLDGLSAGKSYTQDDEGYYHFKLYGASNAVARSYLLNDISDLCLYYRDRYGGSKGSDAYDVTSNTITIKSQEIKDMLNDMEVVY